HAEERALAGEARARLFEPAFSTHRVEPASFAPAPDGVRSSGSPKGRAMPRGEHPHPDRQQRPARTRTYRQKSTQHHPHKSKTATQKWAAVPKSQRSKNRQAFSEAITLSPTSIPSASALRCSARRRPPGKRTSASASI